MSDIDLNFRPKDYFQYKENNDSNILLVSQNGFVNSGEYLSELSSNEIEICRLVLDSSSIDITSLRVKKNKDRYAYKMVDEQSSKFILPIKTSIKTLKMKELIEIFDNLIEPIAVYENIENKMTSEEINQFVNIESSFYPEIGNYYSSMIEKWTEEIDTDNADLE